MTFLDNAGRKGKVTNQNLFDYYGDTHPKTASHWADQQRLAGVPYLGGLYSSYMVGRSTNERNAQLRELYGYGSGNAPVGAYPWLASVNASDPEAKALGSLAGTALGMGGLSAIMRIYGRGRLDDSPYEQVGPNSWRNKRSYPGMFSR